MKNILITSSIKLSEQKQLFLHALAENLINKGYTIITSSAIDETIATLQNNARIVCLILDWEDYKINSIIGVGYINPDLPIFAISDTNKELDLNLQELNFNLDFLQYSSYLINEDAIRINNAIFTYINTIIPEFTRELMRFAESDEYTFCTPGHMGGTAFNESPIGSIFYDFFGENVFKTDVSISVPELGSLLDHSGLHKTAEEFIAEVFKADRSYIVTNGTSTANKMVGMYSASDGDTILVDRNCHKSICHFMMMTNVIPLYLKPTRNAYGIIGGIQKSEFSQVAIQQKIKNCPIPASQPNYAVITNSTYVGLLYDTNYIQQTLNIAKLHFDGAWIPYACFHPIYQNKHAMCLTPANNQVIFETQSTHKLLAAFSQASMIHIKGNYTEDIMNECFMLHTSTSPLYQIVSSCEVSAAMLKGVRGFNLINGAIERAIAFRSEVKRLKHEAQTWYFDVWQPDNIKHKECWNLNKKDTWHGFKEEDQSHMSLDPIKITILTPGISNNKLDIFGIPASIVSMYLDSHAIIVSSPKSTVN